MPLDPKIYIPTKTGELLHASTADVNYVQGPVGSGKSSMMCANQILKSSALPVCKDKVRRARTVIIRNTMPQLKSTTIKTWENWWPSIRYGRIKWCSPIMQTMCWVDEWGFDCEFEFWFLAMDKEKDEEKALSLEASHAWINEARQIKQNIFQGVKGRIGRYPSLDDYDTQTREKLEEQFTRKKEKPLEKLRKGDIIFSLDLDTNAPPETSWLVQEFHTNAHLHTNWAIFKQPAPLIKTQTGYIENPEAENVENLSKGFAYYFDLLHDSKPEWFKVMVMNEYGAAFDGEAVYKDYNPLMHRMEFDIEPTTGYPLYLGFDFGGTPACIVVQFVKGQCRVLDELCSKETISLDSFVKSFVLPLLTSPKYLGKGHINIHSIADPSGIKRQETDASFAIQVLNNYGLNAIGCYTQVPQKRQDSIRHFLNTNISGEPGFVLSKSCIFTHEALAGAYHYKFFTKASTGQTVTSDEVDKNHPHSDIVDALQYTCAQNLIYLEDNKPKAPDGFWMNGRFIYK